MCVCLSVGLLVCFLSATRHLSTLRRCLRVAERAGAAVAGGPARAAGKHAQQEHARAKAVQLLNEKIAALMPFKNKTVRARACCRIRDWRDFQKKGKRKPTCHFPSSVYSLPSLGVFTFRIVLNRILHKSSLLAPMESFVTSKLLAGRDFVLDLWSEPTLVSSCIYTFIPQSIYTTSHLPISSVVYISQYTPVHQQYTPLSAQYIPLSQKNGKPEGK